MLTAEQNERLTQTGADTPMGKLLRMYWHPIAATAQLEKNPVMAVRILSENLTLFRARNGTLGLVGQRCAHRRVDLRYAFPSPHYDDAIVCPYHGWAFHKTGKCLAQPMEPEDSTFKDKVQIAGYHARELAGIIFAYLGPEPVPELPAWEPMVMEDTLRYIEYGTVPCNWVQLQENSPDRKHTQWLHGHYAKWALNRRGVGDDDPQYQSTMRFVDFPTDEFFMEPFEYGHIRRNTIKGSDKNEGSYTIGTPLIFPNMNITASGARFTMIWRTPVDDVTTMSWFLYGVYPGEGIEIPPQNQIETAEIPTYDKNGQLNNHLTAVQDHIACFAQGEILDRSQERLGTTDHDIIVWRKTIMDQLALLESGGTPMNVFHDPEMGKFIKVPLICKDDPNRFGAWSLTADRKYQKRSATVNYSVPDLPIVEEMEKAAELGAAAWIARRTAEMEAEARETEKIEAGE